MKKASLEQARARSRAAPPVVPSNRHDSSGVGCDLGG